MQRVRGEGVSFCFRVRVYGDRDVRSMGVTKYFLFLGNHSKSNLFILSKVIPPADSLISSSVLAFAENQLGVISSEWILQRKCIVDSVQMDSDWDATDVALGIVYIGIQEDEEFSNQLKNEFLGYIYTLCCDRRGLTRNFPAVKRIANTHDLLGEVILDLLGSSSSMMFLGRHRFCTLVWMRMGWKAQQIARRKSHQALPRDGDLEIDGSLESPPDESVRKEDLALLERALGQLRPRQRELINLYLRQRTSAEIGEVLGMNPPAVRKALQRALDSLALVFSALVI